MTDYDPMKKIVFAISLLASHPALSTEFVELSRAGGLAFGRHAITGQLEIHQGGKPMELPIDVKINYFPQLAFEFQDKVYLLVYDVAANVPSGRRLSRGAEENDLYEIINEEGVLYFEKVAALSGGLDIKPRISSTGLLCGSTACLKIKKPFLNFFGKTAFQSISVPTNHEIIEIKGNKILIQRIYNDQVEDLPSAETSIFFVCDAGKNLEDCASIPSDIIPYNILVDGSYTKLSNGEDLLQFDYNRLGLANFSEPNLEGRIAWSNVYFICALSSLHQFNISERFKSEIEKRLVKEIEALAILGETAYPRFKVRRYSYDREPLDFLLHYSRIATAIERSRSVIGETLAARALRPLLGEIAEPTQMVEVIADGELKIRRYVPFWADGANLPWNYQSAWVEALALTGTIRQHQQTVERFYRNFDLAENLSSQPSKWGYAGGILYSGWSPTDDISTNTPTWAGQKTSNLIAHISYRSMDALAILEAERTLDIAVPMDSAQIAELVSLGFLYPFVNQALEQKASIPFHIARHYARSSVPWHFQNQVWAVRAITMSEEDL